MRLPVLETPRLRLRPVVSYDAHDIQWLFPRWEIIQYMAPNKVPWPYPEDGAQRYLHDKLLPAMREGRRLAWALTLKSRLDDGLIGVITLKPKHPAANRSFWLSSEWQARGYMTEASFAINDFAFTELKMPELLFTSADDNTPSIRIKQNSGAECVQRGEYAFHAGNMPISRWHLTARNWQARRSEVWKSLADKVAKLSVIAEPNATEHPEASSAS